MLRRLLLLASLALASTASGGSRDDLRASGSGVGRPLRADAGLVRRGRRLLRRPRRRPRAVAVRRHVPRHRRGRPSRRGDRHGQRHRGGPPGAHGGGTPRGRHAPLLRGTAGRGRKGHRVDPPRASGRACGREGDTNLVLARRRRRGAGPRRQAPASPLPLAHGPARGRGRRVELPLGRRCDRDRRRLLRPSRPLAGAAGEEPAHGRPGEAGPRLPGARDQLGRRVVARTGRRCAVRVRHPRGRPPRQAAAARAGARGRRGGLHRLALSHEGWLVR